MPLEISIIEFLVKYKEIFLFVSIEVKIIFSILSLINREILL